MCESLASFTDKDNKELEGWLRQERQQKSEEGIMGEVTVSH